MISGRFSVLAVTTLEKFLLSSEVRSRGEGTLKMLAIEERPMSVLRGLAASIGGKSRPDAVARSAFPGGERNHHRRRALQRDPRRGNLSRRARTPDQPAARAAVVLREAGSLVRPSMTELRKLVSEELSLPVDARVSTVARAIAAKHGKASPGGPILRIVPAREAARWADARFLPDRVELSRGL